MNLLTTPNSILTSCIVPFIDNRSFARLTITAKAIDNKINYTILLNGFYNTKFDTYRPQMPTPKKLFTWLRNMDEGYFQLQKVKQGILTKCYIAILTDGRFIGTDDLCEEEPVYPKIVEEENEKNDSSSKIARRKQTEEKVRAYLNVGPETNVTYHGRKKINSDIWEIHYFLERLSAQIDIESADGTERTSFKNDFGYHSRSYPSISAFTTLSANRLAVATDSTNEVRIYQIFDYSNHLISTLTGHNKPITHILELNPTIIVTASDDNTLRIWNLFNQTTMAVLRAHTKPITGMVKLHSNHIATVAKDNKLCIWNLNDYSLAKTIEIMNSSFEWNLATGYPHCLTVLTDGRLVMANGDSHLSIWDANDNFAYCELEQGGICEQHDHWNGVYSPVALPGNRLAFLAYTDSENIVIYDMNRNSCLTNVSFKYKTLSDDEPSCVNLRGLQLLPDGRLTCNVAVGFPGERVENFDDIQYAITLNFLPSCHLPFPTPEDIWDDDFFPEEKEPVSLHQEGDGNHAVTTPPADGDGDLEL